MARAPARMTGTMMGKQVAGNQINEMGKHRGGRAPAGITGTLTRPQVAGNPIGGRGSAMGGSSGSIGRPLANQQVSGKSKNR